MAFVPATIRAAAAERAGQGRVTRLDLLNSLTLRSQDFRGE